MLLHDTTQIDAILLVQGDPFTAERCAARLAAASLDVPLRTWFVFDDPNAPTAESLSQRCTWAKTVESPGSSSDRLAQGIAAGHAPFVLLVDAGHSLESTMIAPLLHYLNTHSDETAVGLGAFPEWASEIELGSSGPVVLVRREALEALSRDPSQREAGGNTDTAEDWHHRVGASLRTNEGPTLNMEQLDDMPQRLVLCQPGDPLRINRERYRERHQASIALLDRSPEGLRSELVRRVNRAFEDTSWCA